VKSIEAKREGLDAAVAVVDAVALDFSVVIREYLTTDCFVTLFFALTPSDLFYCEVILDVPVMYEVVILLV
jgi:hypothetical protein